MAITRPAFVLLAAVLLVAPRAAPSQDTSSHHQCAPTFHSKVVAWRAAHPTDPGNVPVVGIDTLDTLPEILTHPPLEYPREAQSAGYEGRVIVVALVDENGKVSSAEAIDSHVEPHRRFPNPTATSPNSADLAAWEFRRAAVQAIRLTRYRPGFRDGKPVATLICVPLTFKISP